MEKFKKKPQIIGISQTGTGGSIFLDSSEKLSAERGKCIQDCTHFQDILSVLFVMIIIPVYYSHIPNLSSFRSELR